MAQRQGHVYYTYFRPHTANSKFPFWEYYFFLAVNRRIFRMKHWDVVKSNNCNVHIMYMCTNLNDGVIFITKKTKTYPWQMDRMMDNFTERSKSMFNIVSWYQWEKISFFHLFFFFLLFLQHFYTCGLQWYDFKVN